MTRILSKPAPALDISSAAFRGAASDLGEVLAFMAGGVRPDPDTLSRLCLSLRTLQGFLLSEAQEQAGREAIAEDQMVRAVLAARQFSLVTPCHPVLAGVERHLARAHG